MPRMSNAFARKHGIDPKHNPLLNVQAIALQQEVHQVRAAHLLLCGVLLQPVVAARHRHLQLCMLLLQHEP
jgi:hypothetical protein